MLNSLIFNTLRCKVFNGVKYLTVQSDTRIKRLLLLQRNNDLLLFALFLLQ